MQYTWSFCCCLWQVKGHRCSMQSTRYSCDNTLKKKRTFSLHGLSGKSHWLVSSCCKPHSFFMAAFAFVPSANYLLVFLLKSILTLVPCSIKALAALLQTDPQRPRGLLRSFVVQQPRGPETHGLVVRVLGRRRRPLETW